jgi:hypothetical protein
MLGLKGKSIISTGKFNSASGTKSLRELARALGLLFYESESAIPNGDESDSPFWSFKTKFTLGLAHSLLNSGDPEVSFWEYITLSEFSTQSYPQPNLFEINVEKAHPETGDLIAYLHCDNTPMTFTEGKKLFEKIVDLPQYVRVGKNANAVTDYFWFSLARLNTTVDEYANVYNQLDDYLIQDEAVRGTDVDWFIIDEQKLVEVLAKYN